MMMGGLVLLHTTKNGLKYLLEKFHTNTMSVALLAISFFGTFLKNFFSNTVPPVKFLIVIILVVKELNFIVQE